MCSKQLNRISGVMVSVFASCVEDHGLWPRLCQTKDYQICTCCFSSKDTALWSNSKNLLARNQDNMSEGSNMSICSLLFQ